MTSHTSWRRVMILVAIVAGTLVTVCIASATGESPTVAQQKSAALAERGAPSIGSGDSSEAMVGEAAIRRAAADEARAMPVAPGGTFDDIRWADLGAATRNDIRALLEANAACDWWKAAAESRSPAALHIARETARWSTLRSGGAGHDARAVAGAIDQGDFEEVRNIAAMCHNPPQEVRGPVPHPICGTPEATDTEPCIVAKDEMVGR